MPGLPIPDHILTKLHRIAELARQAPDMVFRGLTQHIDVEFLRVAYTLVRKGGAAGVDGMTADAYAENLDENLSALLNRFKSGTYRAPPVKRVHIPKGDGKTRPIGIPTFEDKVLQRAVTMILNAIYEEDFLRFSYGFRPRRSAHQALEALWKVLMDMGGGWVLDVDIKAFFDTLSPSHLRSFLDQRVVDGVLRRSIDKWLKAGVLEDGNVFHSELGTPQGGVISPLLANIYLHEVLDKWFVREVQPRLGGPAHLIRYADDFVIVCAEERDARRVLEVLPQRFAKFGLTTHPDKTRLVAFGRPPLPDPARPAKKSVEIPKTFDLLGFTHYWGLSRKGRWAVFRKTALKRYLRCTGVISQWCQRSRHAKVGSQNGSLNDKLRGHYNYYGIIGNARDIGSFRNHTLLTWKYWLNRRGNRASLTWPRYKRLLQRYPLLPARLPKRALQSEASSRGAGCGSPARPDLRGDPGCDTSGFRSRPAQLKLRGLLKRLG